MQHNMEDYVAYLIRLGINVANLNHDVDYYIWERYKSLNVSWFPNGSTYYIENNPLYLSQGYSKKFDKEKHFAKLKDIESKVGKLLGELEFTQTRRAAHRRSMISSSQNLSNIKEEPGSPSERSRESS